MSVDASNNIFVTGNFGETVNFGCGSSLAASQSNVTDVFLVKFTQGLSCTWAKGFGGTGTFDRDGQGVTTGADGSVAITGSFCGSMSFGGPTLNAAGACASRDVFAARLAPDGSHLNSTRVGGVGSEIAFDVAQSSDGRFFVTGAFSGAAEFGGSLFTAAGGDDAFVVGLEAF